VTALQNQVSTLQSQLNDVTTRLDRICANGLVYYAYLSYFGSSIDLSLDKVYCGS
jgi:hypothetical protein